MSSDTNTMTPNPRFTLSHQRPVRRGAPRCGIAGRLALLVSILAVTDAAQAESYRCDFRGGQFDNQAPRLSGPGANRLVKPAEDGLEITAPQGHAPGEIGFAPRFALRGDFEIVAGFEILHVEAPDAGYGVGPSLHIGTNSSGEHAGTISRRKSAKNTKKERAPISRTDS